MRKIQISLGEYYHIYNRGNNKQTVFYNNSDFARFLFLLLCLQSPFVFESMSRYTKLFVQSLALNMSEDVLGSIIANRFVDLVCFTLMQNHFHLILREKKEGGISRYLHRILTAYTKYANIKYEKSGHVFQGTFQAVHIKDNEQLLYLSAYIHRNPHKLARWQDREQQYPWSSYQDYCGVNRWGGLLQSDILTSQFTNDKDYLEYVKSSGAKSNNILEDDHLDLFKA